MSRHSIVHQLVRGFLWAIGWMGAQALGLPLAVAAGASVVVWLYLRARSAGKVGNRGTH